MRLLKSYLHLAALLTLSSVAIAASSWGFTDATVSIQTKGAGVGGGLKEKLIEKKPLSKTIQLGAADTLKLILTTQDGKTAKRPHQAFLSLKDPESGLETSFPLSVKESGKANVDLTQKDIPTQLLLSASPLSASLIVASFGSSKPYDSLAFSLEIIRDLTMPLPSVENPLRYGKLPEIQHIFKADPRSPPKIITLFFTAIVLAALPVVLIAWATLGGNLNHLQKAFSSSPVSHALFFGSILAMEGIFFKYYTTWNLFDTLPPAIVVGLVIFLSGSRALSEVQDRRLAGLR